MYWERVTEEIFVFTSERYALVNAVAVMTRSGVVVIDALPFPDEARAIAHFLDAQSGGRFAGLILTHYHMDHVYGLSLFPDHLDLISSDRCRDTLLTIGEASLEEARRHDPQFEEITLRIPNVTFHFGEEPVLETPDKRFRLIPLPGHTPDNIGVFYEEERVLITGDAVMAIPIIADGDWREEIETLQAIKRLAPETIIQGHGEVILRGEVQSVLDRYIAYLECVEEQARKVLKAGEPRESLREIPLERCGLERVPLGIASHALHAANLFRIYDTLKEEAEADR